MSPSGFLQAVLLVVALGVTVPDEKRGMIGYGSLDLVVDTLEKAIAGKSALVDGRFSAADVYVGSHLAWGTQFGTLPKRPAFEAYCKGLAARPTARSAASIDDALAAKHPMPGR